MMSSICIQKIQHIAFLSITTLNIHRIFLTPVRTSRLCHKKSRLANNFLILNYFYFCMHRKWVTSSLRLDCFPFSKKKTHNTFTARASNLLEEN